MKKAIVIGSTGLVGTQLVQLLLRNNFFTEILSLVRRPTGLKHSKLTEKVIDFDLPDTWGNLIDGDVLFSTLGTTLADAKSKTAQFEVDFIYQYNVAQAAANNGVSNYVLVSSAGADPSSKSFYLSMKGKLENSVQKLPFENISIIRPGQLAGERKSERYGEKIGLKLMTGLNKLGLLKKYRPIHSSLVATAMINAANKRNSSTYTLTEVFSLAKEVG